MTSNVSPRNRLERILKRRRDALKKGVPKEGDDLDEKETNEDVAEQPDRTSEKPAQP